MAGKPRIPTQINAFNAYINSTDDYNTAGGTAGPPPLPNNATRLTLSPQNITDWHDKRVLWHDDLYHKWSTEGLKTKVVNKDVRLFIKEFKTFAQPLLNKMASSGSAISADEGAYHFVIVPAAPTRPTVVITEQCFPTLATIGGGEVRLSVRSDSDTGRPSILPGADSFELAFKVIEANGTLPQNPDDGTQKQVITRASIVQQTGVNNLGKRACVFVRWYLTKYPYLAGPWSQLVTILIV